MCIVYMLVLVLSDMIMSRQSKPEREMNNLIKSCTILVIHEILLCLLSVLSIYL